MNLELNDAQLQALAETLDSSLLTLSDEIQHTDTREYREFLMERREVLSEIRRRLH